MIFRAKWLGGARVVAQEPGAQERVLGPGALALDPLILDGRNTFSNAPCSFSHSDARFF